MGLLLPAERTVPSGKDFLMDFLVALNSIVLILSLSRGAVPNLYDRQRLHTDTGHHFEMTTYNFINHNNILLCAGDMTYELREKTGAFIDFLLEM
jgi:hypothetical protein